MGRRFYRDSTLLPCLLNYPHRNWGRHGVVNPGTTAIRFPMLSNPPEPVGEYPNPVSAASRVRLFLIGLFSLFAAMGSGEAETFGLFAYTEHVDITSSTIHEVRWVKS